MIPINEFKSGASVSQKDDLILGAGGCQMHDGFTGKVGGRSPAMMEISRIVISGSRRNQKVKIVLRNWLTLVPGRRFLISMIYAVADRKIL